MAAKCEVDGKPDDEIELAYTASKDGNLFQTRIGSMNGAAKTPAFLEKIDSRNQDHHRSNTDTSDSLSRGEMIPLQTPYTYRASLLTIRDNEYMKIIEKMIAKGWCSHHVLHLYRTVTPSMFTRLSDLYLSPVRYMDHSRCLNHDSCVTYNVNMDAYNTRHCDECTGCSFIAVNNEELVSIIRGGDIPLVSIEVDVNNLNLSLRLHKQREFSTYTAISHVWADGLGNTNANALPICQLRALRSRLKRVYGKSKNMFWLDTLCIPVRPEDIDSRNISIDRMGLIYASASLVLVLDRELMTLSPHQNPEECLARIFSSVWMSRSWTLQEGVLAKLCAFEFRDVVMTVREGIGLCNLEYSTTARRNLVEIVPGLGLSTTPQATTSDFYQHATRRYVNLFSSGFSHSGHHGKFTLVWNELAGRSTTKSNDIFVILANVLGFSCQSFLALSSDERIAAIILCLDYVPLSLFFINVPRQDPSRLHPNNWFPRSIGVEKLCSDMPVLKRRRDCLIMSSRADYSRRLAIFIVWSLFSPTISDQRIRYPDVKTTFICRVSSDDISQYDLSGHHFTCIIMDRLPSQNKNTYRGAIFFGTQRATHGKQIRLDLTYRCSATFETIPFPEGVSTGEGPEVERVKGAYKLNIAYGKENKLLYTTGSVGNCHSESNSRLCKFYKRAAVTLYANAFMVKCWPWLTVVAFVSLVAAFISIFVSDDGHRWLGALFFAAATIFTLIVMSVPIVRLIHDRLARKRRLGLNRASV